ncbi:MAG: YcaQ family DNA glycosylase [Acidobacteria bacterium]|nr:YcaQ family DNA glycosylase [Acidobacteriota bacterium]
MPRPELSLAEARRIALAAQGFDRPRLGKVRASHLGSAIRRLGLIQLDFVNVLVPSHYLVLFSRLGAYPRSLLDDLVYKRREFTEQWAHEASIVPVETWPLLRHRMETHRVRPWGFEKFLEQRSAYTDWVLNQVRERGPLTADDLPEPEDAPRRMADRWGWGRAVRRQVFEAHFGFGRMAVVNRLPNFARVYDLAERIVPLEHYGCKVAPVEAQRKLLHLAARAHGIGTAADLADYYRMPVKEARPRLAELAESGELREVRVEGWRETAYLDRQARLPGHIDAEALLSPFDPVVWHRERVRRLFDFDYRLEIFVPAGKRKWGYFVLPFLLGDRLVARVDLKADRPARRLLVLAAHYEKDVKRRPAGEALARELRALGSWLGLDSVEWKQGTG